MILKSIKSFVKNNWKSIIGFLASIFVWILVNEDVLNSSCSLWGYLIFGGINFAGFPQRVDVSHNALFNFGTGDFSASCWFNSRNVINRMPLGKDTYAGGNTYTGFFIQYNIFGNKKIRFATRNVVSGSGPESYLDSINTYNAGTWYYVLAVRISNVLYLYVNGQLDNTLAESAPTNINNATDFNIGKGDSTASTHLDGMVEEVTVWNTGLIASEASILYNARQKYLSLGIQNNNVVGLWPMDDGVDGSSSDTDQVRDISSNGLNGTATGGTWEAESILNYPPIVIPISSTIVPGSPWYQYAQM